MCYCGASSLLVVRERLHVNVIETIEFEWDGAKFSSYKRVVIL